MLDPWMERLNNSISNLALTSLTSSTSSVPAAVAVATPFNSIRKKSNNSSSSSNNNNNNNNNKTNMYERTLMTPLGSRAGARPTFLVDRATLSLSFSVSFPLFDSPSEWQRDAR